MVDLLLQVWTLVLLIVGIGWGARRWVRPRAAVLSLRSTGLLILLVLTFMGGFIGSPIWWTDDIRSFSWDLPPLASRMLAAAGWSFAVVSFHALERPTVRRVRLILILLAMYLAPLVLAIVLFHRDRFDWRAPITYGFFVIAGGMSLATIGYLVRQPVVLEDEPWDAAPPLGVVRTWLGLVTVLTTLWGLALFATDAGPSPLIWAWPGDLLTSRLIGVMLLTVAAGSATAARYAGTAQMMLAMTATYGAGVALASFWNTLSGKPIKMAYAIVFAVIFAGSTLLLLRNPRLQTQQAGVP